MLSSIFAIVFVHIICICNILSLLMCICTGEDFISLQLVSYPFVLFCMTIKYTLSFSSYELYFHLEMESIQFTPKVRLALVTR